jgi:hypothetical protein
MREGKQSMKNIFFKGLLLNLGLVLFPACSSLPTGPERLAQVEQLVAEQEFARAGKLLANIDPRDPAFEALAVRRRAIGPLVVRFEESTIRRVNQLEDTDQWPAAEEVLEEALEKLPDSRALQNAKQQFYADRAARLVQIEREISHLRGEHLSAKTFLVQQVKAVDPEALKTRWLALRHGREAEALAEELSACGEDALAESQYALAASCLKVAASLTRSESTRTQVALLEERRIREEAQAAARAEAQHEAERAARRARKTEKVGQLKIRYRDLFDAGWWAAAQETLTELRNQVPSDHQVLVWSEELQAVIDRRVAAGIEEGQVLYSQGLLHQALAIWREAAKLAPDKPILQAHIARVERFIAKLQRLNKDDV